MTQQPKPQGGAYGSGPSHQKEQHERLQELFNDLAVRRHQELKPAEETGTLYDHAQGDANTVGGRWAAQNRATLSGDKISVDYPTLPDASPWHAGNAVEPPLGFSRLMKHQSWASGTKCKQACGGIARHLFKSQMLTRRTAQTLVNSLFPALCRPPLSGGERFS